MKQTKGPQEPFVLKISHIGVSQNKGAIDTGGFYWRFLLPSQQPYPLKASGKPWIFLQGLLLSHDRIPSINGRFQNANERKLPAPSKESQLNPKGW